MSIMDTSVSHVNKSWNSGCRNVLGVSIKPRRNALPQRNPEHVGLRFCNYTSCDLKWRETGLFIAIPSNIFPGVSVSETADSVIVHLYNKYTLRRR